MSPVLDWQDAVPTLLVFDTQDATLWQESPRPGVCCVTSYNALEV